MGKPAGSNSDLSEQCSRGLKSLCEPPGDSAVKLHEVPALPDLDQFSSPARESVWDFLLFLNLLSLEFASFPFFIDNEVANFFELSSPWRVLVC